jgi:hypothetical protein
MSAKLGGPPGGPLRYESPDDPEPEEKEVGYPSKLRALLPPGAPGADPGFESKVVLT